MTEALLTNLFTLDGFVQLIKYLVVAGELIYLVFAFLITRQVSLMNKSFHTGVAELFSLIALVHMLATIMLILISLSLL